MEAEKRQEKIVKIKKPNLTILTVKNALDKAINESDLFSDFCYRHCPLYKAFQKFGLIPKIPCRDLCSLMRFRDYINGIVYASDEDEV